jgi:hypothetical protein
MVAALKTRCVSNGVDYRFLVKSTPGVMYGAMLKNDNAASMYVRFYDSQNAPDVAAVSPFMVVRIGANISLAIPMPDQGIRLTQGLWVVLTTGAADNNTTATAANDVSVTVYHGLVQDKERVGLYP